MQQNKPTVIEESSIIKQVERVCRSKEFRSKELLCRFLSYIVSEYLAGRSESIKGYSIGVDVFNKGEDFDPGQDALVRIHAGRLRRLLKLYYLVEGKNDAIQIEIPVGSYTPRFSYHKFSDPSSDNATVSNNQETLPSNSKVAILPFRNLTGDPAKEFFSQGFSEELSVELTRYEDLMVFNSTQKISYLNDHSANDNFFKSKGIRFVIEGSVSQNTDRVKILVRLTDIMEGRQLWAESYHESMSTNNLMEIQERITKEIAVVLGCEYGFILQKLSLDAQRVKPKRLDTYMAVLRFYYFEMHQTHDAFAEAFDALNQALELEPESGIAKAMLAIMHGNRYVLDYPDARKSYELLGDLAEQAACLDPKSHIVKVALAFKCFVYNEKERFFRIFEQSLSHYPNKSVKLGSMAFHMSLYGDWERGKKILDGLMHAGIGFPLYFHGCTMLYYYRKNQYDKALEEANKYDVPGLFWNYMLRAAVLGQLNKPVEARTNIMHLKQLKPDFEVKARYLISRFVKEDELVDHILEGLRNAGMQF